MYNAIKKGLQQNDRGTADKKCHCFRPQSWSYSNMLDINSEPPPMAALHAIFEKKKTLICVSAICKNMLQITMIFLNFWPNTHIQKKAKGGSDITNNWSQFSVGFFRPVGRYLHDYGTLSEWSTGWMDDRLFVRKWKLYFLDSVWWMDSTKC